jgi:dipeptidyl-peptidase-4
MRPALGLAFLLPYLALSGQDSGKLTVDSLFHPTRKVAYLAPEASRFQWRPNGSLVEERLRNDKLVELALVDPGSWESRPLLSAAQFSAALVAAGADPAEAADAFRGAFQWQPGQDAFLAPVGAELYLFDLAKGQARPVSDTAGAKDSAEFSPDGTRVAYLRGNDLYVTELATGKETRLTTGGDDDHFNGRLDWVYQEEVFERDHYRGFWWSRDSRRIAFLSLDDSQVPTYTLADDRGFQQRLVSNHYPRPGEPNPVARLGIAELDGTVAWMEDPFPGQETLVVGVEWDPEGRLVANYQDRIQSWLDCRRFENGRGSSLVREDSRAWVEHLPLPRFLKDGSFVWASARTGFHHLYRYDRGGQLRGAVTEGAWDVRTLYGVDEAKGQVFFSATQRNPIGLDGYSADLEPGPGGGHLQRLTSAPGTHDLTFNASFTAAQDRWSDINTPAQTMFINRDGIVTHRIASEPTPALQALRLGKVSFQTIAARDGFPLETMLVLPPDFDPARKYPVFQYVYGGPNTPMVRNAYSRSALWFQFLAQQGIVTWICDNRSASAKGTAAHAMHRNLGALELRDQLDGLAWLKAQGWADMARVALYGYSYGGYLTAYAVTHSKAWKLGIIGAPVVDWRLYDSIYTERYMGLPRDNAAGYEASSALLAAGQLAAKVMLIHGTLDDNVHPQNSVQFIDALAKTGQVAPLTLLPGASHGFRTPHLTWSMYQSIWEFLHANL